MFFTLGEKTFLVTQWRILEITRRHAYEGISKEVLDILEGSFPTIIL
jgi:hypothetical protein